MYEEYNEGSCDMQYDRCLKYKRNDGVKIGTFFFICKQFGKNLNNINTKTVQNITFLSLTTNNKANTICKAST